MISNAKIYRFCCLPSYQRSTRQWRLVYKLNLNSTATAQTALSFQRYHWHHLTSAPTLNPLNGSPLPLWASVYMWMWKRRSPFASINIWMSTAWRRMSITALKMKNSQESKNRLLIWLIKDHFRLIKTYVKVFLITVINYHKVLLSEIAWWIWCY